MGAALGHPATTRRTTGADAPRDSGPSATSAAGSPATSDSDSARTAKMRVACRHREVVVPASQHHPQPSRRLQLVRVHPLPQLRPYCL